MLGIKLLKTMSEDRRSRDKASYAVTESDVLETIQLVKHMKVGIVMSGV